MTDHRPAARSAIRGLIQLLTAHQPHRQQQPPPAKTQPRRSARRIAVDAQSGEVWVSQNDLESDYFHNLHCIRRPR